jgi:hypothetical protein
MPTQQDNLCCVVGCNAERYDDQDGMVDSLKDKCFQHFFYGE